MKFLDFSKVLCLSPHPDDIEFAMAGTIMNHRNTNFTSVVFSTGSVFDPVSNKDRWNECLEYWKGVRNITQEFMAPLLAMYTEEEWLNLLEKQFPLNQFDAIFMPPNLDTHYEHRIVNNIGMAMTRVTPASIIEYKSVSVTDPWIPNVIVNIEPVAEEKVKRLKRFESQKKVYFTSNFMKSYHTHVSSLKRGLQVVEQFRIIDLYV